MLGDERIPVSPRPAGAAGPGPETALVLGPGEAPVAGAAVEWLAARPALHGAACACCAPRAALAEALHRLFLRRARGEVGFFRRVAVSLPPAEIRAALADPLVAQRFRADEASEGARFHCA